MMYYATHIEATEAAKAYQQDKEVNLTCDEDELKISLKASAEVAENGFWLPVIEAKTEQVQNGVYQTIDKMTFVPNSCLTPTDYFQGTIKEFISIGYKIKE